jgi:hypothetical protein
MEMCLECFVHVLAHKFTITGKYWGVQHLEILLSWIEVSTTLPWNISSDVYCLLCSAGKELEGAWHRTHKKAAQKLACYLEDLPAKPPLQPVLNVAKGLSIAAGLAVDGLALSGAAAAAGRWGGAGWQGSPPLVQQQQQLWRQAEGVKAEGQVQLRIAGNGVEGRACGMRAGVSHMSVVVLWVDRHAVWPLKLKVQRGI